jgi:replicative DNA helicase
MSRIETHGLPQDLDCESYVLGAVLKRCEMYWPQVADLLTAQDFSLDRHRIIWQRVQDLIADGIAVDRVTVFKALADRGEVEAAGGLSYIIGLDDNMPDLPNVSTYAQRVREKSTLRQGILACQSIIERLAAPGAGPEDIVAAEAAIKRVSEAQAKKRRLVSIAEVIQGGVEGETAAAFLDASQRSPGVQGPWRWLNHATGGFRGGNLVILAARPSVGKTSAAAQFMLHAIMSGIGGVFVTLEMPKRDIVRKLVAAHAGVSLSEWQNGELDAGGRRAIRASTIALRQAEAYFDDQPRATVPGIHAAILRHRAEHDVRFIVIDYLQLLTPAGRGHNRTEDVSEITRGLKLMAMELDVPVIALSQLSRASAKDSREPRLDDLRDSGSIEQDADIVLFLHRVEKPFVKLILAKQRLGPIGDVRLVFDRQTAVFSEIEGGGYDEAHQ